MSRRLRLALEEDLNVDKLAQSQQLEDQTSEFDSLYNDVKEKIEQKEELAADETDNEIDESTDPEIGDETTPTDDTVDDAEPSLESIFNLYEETRQQHAAMEAFFNKESLYAAGRYVGERTAESLRYLKDMGFEYGPVLLKHVYKGVLIAVDKTLRAIMRGGIAITKYVKRRMESYTAFKEKIAKVRETLALIKDNPASESDPSKLFFSNPVVISQLKIGESLAFDENIKVAETFVERYFDIVGHKVNSSVHAVNYMMGSVIKSNVKHPENFMREDIGFSGLSKMKVPGYEPESDYCDSVAYSETLPGDIFFIGHIPSTTLKSRDEVVQAYSNSKLFLGFNEKNIGSVKSCPYNDLDGFSNYLDSLDRLCDIGLSHESTFADIIKMRNSIRKGMTNYMRFLSMSNDKVSIEDSLSEYISLKLEFLDKTYVAGSLRIHDYIVRLLTASLTYIKAGVQAIS